ncbi:MAG: LysR family transcriptional regulator [Mesorhizobium sp.]|uniref:LysR substrate-binding domain-containing protein n=1 Tax=Mesorhizobium sp. TaxID=1871066 RepID=UPI000FE820B0|nr:LysR substrate-binding domain-containing protein [Mesorhizobium sp.]RWI57084.1 MAG: LysR family transcriptional regulator [Mesorhizobium sp.]
MKLHHFRNVVAIAEQGSLRAAARHLQLAQPALTRSLGELEREVGAPLFERRARGMVLTPMGHAFVRRATAILHEVRRAREEVDQIQGGRGGSVVAGLSIAAHIAMLPKSLRPFRLRYPGVQLHIIEGFYPTLEAGLKDGGVDFYIGPQPERAVPKKLVQEELFRNTRTILCRKGHPLAGSKSLRDLVDAEWMTTSITLRAEEEFEGLFARYELPPPRLAIRSQSALTLIMALAYSDLLAMAPIQWTEFALTADVLQSIDVMEELPAPPIVLIHRASLPLTPAATFMVDLIRRGMPRQG